VRYKLTTRANHLADRLKQFLDWATVVREQTGKSLLTQIGEIRSLRYTGGQCGLSDYYWYKLYDDDYLYNRGREDFLGWRLQASLSLALNPRNAVLPAWDKCVFMLMASAAGLPTAPIIACFHPARRISEVLGIHLKSRREVGAFLRNPSIYPMFGKPAFSQQGYGTAYLASYDPSTDRLALLNHESIVVDDFLVRMEQTIDHRYHRPECGFLFQQAFTLAPEIHEFTSWPAICGVRIICLNDSEGVRPIRAIWKIATPPNHVDNFSLGKNGNLLANVDLESGEVSRVIGGFWPNTKIHNEHPISGKVVKGFQLPGWQQILDTCHQSGAVFPLMRIHHWDFALTDHGPLILELNDLGGTEIAQVHGHGLLTPEIRAFIKRHANAQDYPWVKAL
jgi:hypothetical protein